jgi:hypothetical protein
MSSTVLFALDKNTDEVIVSESAKGSNKITFIKRISKQENGLLYSAVVILTNISTAENLDVALFKAMDKVCQMIYSKG